jgi:TRAP-type C4-dicarboxylate transport system substrate-binding protein
MLSDSMKDALNKETYNILNQCAKEVEDFLRKDWALEDRFVQELIKKDELEYDEIHAIFAEFGKARTQVPIQSVKLTDEKPTEGAAPSPFAAGAPPALPPQP